MTQDTTTTSGAADLPEALINIAREIEALKRECGMDPESSIAVQNGRYMAISYKVRALAAGQATAAQQGVAYATLRSMIEGMSVSVDVSTGDHDAGHRYFGTVTEVMECQGNKHGVTLLIQGAEPNFAPTPPAQEADSVTAPAPPPECETEAEKRAFAFGWFKALESERMKADNKKKDPL